MQINVILGLILGIGGVLSGALLEGAHLSSFIQLAAALIVFGGTAGATLVSNSMRDIKCGFALLSHRFTGEDDDELKKIDGEIVDAARLARKESILAIEKRLATYSHPYLRNVFKYMVDGVDPATLRELFEEEMLIEEDKLANGARIWSDAGGYAPTIGIIGAVLGLIQVMANISNTAELAKGIAVAFVATIYGVGSANLIFLPIGYRLKRKIKTQTRAKQMILEGAIAILSGLNPYLIEEKLKTYIENSFDSEAKVS